MTEHRFLAAVVAFYLIFTAVAAITTWQQLPHHSAAHGEAIDTWVRETVQQRWN